MMWWLMNSAKPSIVFSMMKYVKESVRGAFFTRDAAWLWGGCLILVLLCNPYVFLPGQHWSFSLLGVIVSTVLLVCVTACCLKNRITAYVVLPLIILLNIALHVMKEVYGVTLSISVLSSIAETNVNEVLGFCSFGLIAGAIVVVGAVYLVVYGLRKLFCRKGVCPFSMGMVILVGVIYGVCSVLSLPPRATGHGYMKHLFLTYSNTNKALHWPLVDLVSSAKLIYDYSRTGIGNLNMLKRLPSCADAESSCAAPDDLVIVFHMGESIRADHMSFNGYSRLTTPKLAMEPNLISFPKVTSFGLVTRDSVIGMLTDAEMERRTPRYSSFIDLFNKHEFRTVRIMDISEDDVWDYSLGILTNSCRERKRTFDGDKLLLQERSSVTLEQDLASAGSKGKQFYFIYNMGAHMPFTYPKSAEKFTPASCNMANPKKNLQDTINAYDNTLIDMDVSIWRNLCKLRDKTAIYFFCADHGVALGEDGKMFQSHVLPSVYNPAMFVWYSDSFAAQYPDVVNALKNNRNKAVSHDHIYHTILSLGFIKSPNVKQELNLLNPEVKETPVPANPTVLESWIPENQ